MVNYVVQLTSYPETIEEEESEVGSPCEEDPVSQMALSGKPPDGGSELPASCGKEQPPPEGTVVAPAPKSEEEAAAEMRKRRRLEQAGIKVLPAAQRFARLAVRAEHWPGWLCACPGLRNLSDVLEFPSCFTTSCFTRCIITSYLERIEVANRLCLQACLCRIFGYFKWR